MAGHVTINSNSFVLQSKGVSEMKNLRHLLLGVMLGVVPAAVNVQAGSTSQYNMSLQEKVVTGPKGSLTSPQAAAVNKLGQIDEKSVLKIADGIYRIGGWGISNTIAVEAPKGWVIVDAGDYLEVAQEQRRALEDKVGKIKVAAVSANFQLGPVPVAMTLRYFHEFNVRNRLEGDAGWLTISIPLWVPDQEG